MRVLFFYFSIILLLTGCITKEIPKLNNSDLPADYKFKIEGVKEYDKEWWKSFGSDDLNSLIIFAQKNNFDLKLAVKTVEEANLQYKKDRTALFPEIGLNAGYERTKTKNKGFNTVTVNNYYLGLSASYEIDIWGKIREGIKLTELNVLEKRFDYDALFNTIAGEITTNWLNILAIFEKESLLNAKLKLLENQKRLLENKYFSGEISLKELYLIDQQIISTENAIKLLKNNKNIYENRIKILLGYNNMDVELKDRTLPEVDFDIKTPVPSELIRLRPDIRLSEVNLMKSFAAYKISRLERFPTFSISASYKYSSNEISSIFDNWVLNIAANLFYPLIDFNKRKYNELINKIKVDEAFINYKKTVYQAVVDVENGFLNISNSLNQFKTTKKNLQKEEKQYQLIKLKYLSGENSLIDLISEELKLIDYKLDLIDKKLSYLESLVSFYKALGGRYYKEVKHGKEQ